MFKSQYLKRLFPGDKYHFQVLYMNDWHDAIMSGDLQSVRLMLDKEKFSPSHATTFDGENPLTTLLLSTFCNGTDSYIDQFIIAQLLVEKGCELTVPDKYFMIPADYAMISSNAEAAKIVVAATLRQYDKSARVHDHIPDATPFFATCLGQEKRERAYYNLQRNHERIAAHIFDPVNKLENFLGREQYDYWKTPIKRRLSTMPKPDAYLTASFEDAAETIRDYNEACHVEDWDQAARLTDQLEHIRDEIYVETIERILTRRYQTRPHMYDHHHTFPKNVAKLDERVFK